MWMPPWLPRRPRSRPGPTRRRSAARVLLFLELLNHHKDNLAEMITAEHGKVFTDAQGEVSRGIDIVEFACGIRSCSRATSPTRSPPASTTGPFAPAAGRGGRHHAVQLSGHGADVDVPVAIAAGNTFVLKPSPIDPDRLAGGRPAQTGRPAWTASSTSCTATKEAVDALLTTPT